MGRGLSTLQTSILKRAYENHIKEDRPSYEESEFGADVTTHEIKAEIYNLNYEECNKSIRESYGRQMFYTGEDGYNSASAAISRSFKRLEERGLAVRILGRAWAGINLTEEGMNVAKNLVSTR